MKPKLQAFCLGFCICFVSASACADFWSELRDTAGDVGTAAWWYTTAPVDSMVNGAKVITEGGDPKNIFDPYQRLGVAAGNAVEGGYTLAREPEKYMYAKVQKYSQKWGGDTAGFVFDLSTFTSKFMSDLGETGVRASANVMRGQNPLQLTAAPLAAAIRAARDVHDPNSQPLPDDVRSGLTGFFSQETLQRAKYAVGKVEITLPNLLGQGKRLMGDGFAVVVDDIIVFNQSPPSFDTPEGRHWWAHEITHISQYRHLGVERFAWEYLRDGGRSIEGAADNQGAAAEWIQQQGIQMASLSDAQFQTALQATAAAQTTGPIVRQYGPPPEYFVIRCFFPDEMYPVSYFVTNLGKIIAVNNLNGQMFQVGWATPSNIPGVGWMYRTNYIIYSVMPDGRILTLPNVYGQLVQVGFTQLLASGTS